MYLSDEIRRSLNAKTHVITGRGARTRGRMSMSIVAPSPTMSISRKTHSLSPPPFLPSLWGSCAHALRATVFRAPRKRQKECAAADDELRDHEADAKRRMRRDLVSFAVTTAEYQRELLDNPSGTRVMCATACGF